MSGKKGSPFHVVFCAATKRSKRVWAVSASYNYSVVSVYSFEDLVGQKEKKYGPTQRTSSEADDCDPFALRPDILAMTGGRYECAIWENDKVKMTLFSRSQAGIGGGPRVDLGTYTTLVDKALLAEVQSAAR